MHICRFIDVDAFFPQISMVVCVFDLLFICTVIIKCYSHYICSVWGRVLLTNLSNQLKEIVVALKEINREPVNYTSLYSEVMAMTLDGYSEDMLATVFYHLCENKKATGAF